jgi:hypothetical protein
MTALRMTLLTIGLVSLHACVEPDDLALVEQEMRREEIIVRDCRPGFLPFGEGANMTCIPDPGWSGGGGGGGGGGGERGAVVVEEEGEGVRVPVVVVDVGQVARWTRSQTATRIASPAGIGATGTGGSAKRNASTCSPIRET